MLHDRMKIVKLLLVAVCPILFLSNLTGQENTGESAVNSFDEYFSRPVEEKIFIHTDRSVYLPGETIYFKVYSLNSRTNAPASLSRVAYVELLTNKSSPVVSVKVYLTDASGSGHIHLPPDLVTGYFYIRAYTHWMKNLAPINFFTQKIAIIDPYNRLYEFTDSTLLINTNELQCKFFPEGGRMIRNIESLTCVQLCQKVVQL